MRHRQHQPRRRVKAPEYQHVSIFRAVERALAADPAFRAACELFLSWDGSDLDFADPSQDLCPFCRITPAGSPGRMATERQHNAPLMIAVDIATAGTNYDDFGNFWGLIWHVFFDMSDMNRFNNVNTMLQAAGVTRPVMTMQAFHPFRDDDDNVLLRGQGTIAFNSLLIK